MMSKTTLHPAETNDLAGLAAPVEDGAAMIDAELLEGCPVDAHELDEMDRELLMAAHCFATLFGHTEAEGSDADADEGAGPEGWTARLLISRDDLGDLCD